MPRTKTAGWSALLLLAAGVLASENPEVRLRGVIEQAEGGIALLQFGAARSRALRLGEVHRGFRLREVRLDRVLLETPDGGALELRFPDAGAPPAPSRPPPPRPAPAPLPEETVREEPVAPVAAPSGAAPAGERVFRRDEVRLRLQGDLPRILSNSAVAPRVRGNEVEGLELIAFPMDTVLGETGLLPGDVLLSINGREVRGAESLAILVQRFQTASEVELAVDRGGEIVELRYRIE